MRRVSIADTSIADVQVINPYELNLIGHKPGFTTLTVWTGQGHYEERQVRISPDGKQQVLLNCIVAELNRGEVENQGTNFTVALEKYGVSLFGIPGAVGTPYSATANLIPTAFFAIGNTISCAWANAYRWRAHPAAAVAGHDLRNRAQNSNVAANALVPVPRESQHGEDSRAAALAGQHRRESEVPVRW